MRYTKTASLFLITALFSGCELFDSLNPEDDNKEDGYTLVLTEVEPPDLEGGIGLVVSDADNSEQMGYKIKGDGQGNVIGVSTIYYNNSSNYSVAVNLDEQGFPQSIHFSDGHEIRILSHTDTTLTISFYDNGSFIDGPYTINADIQELIEVSKSLASSSSYRVWNIGQSACSWFPNGGCKNMLWWGGKVLSAVGCGTAIASFVGSGGTLGFLSGPAAGAICGSLLVSTASEVLYEKSDNKQKIYVATGLLSNTLQTSTNCILSAIDGMSGAIKCIAGIAKISTALYKEQLDPSEINTNTTLDDSCLSGTWQSTNLTCSQSGQSYTTAPLTIYIEQSGATATINADKSYAWDGTTLSGNYTYQQTSQGTTCSANVQDVWKITNCQSATITITTTLTCSNVTQSIPPVICSSSATKNQGL